MLSRHNGRLEWQMDSLFARLTPRWSLPGTMRLHAPGADVVWLPQPIHWERLFARMEALQADVLISAFFPRRIPEKLFSAFRCGGVNLHPARLPHFRGPSPLQHLLLQDAWLQHGGVTLHCMSAGLDEGEIIAFAHLSEEHWRDRGALDRALGGAMANLVAHALPAWCRGEVGAVPQPEGDFAWACQETDLTVNANWTAEHLRRLLTFFGSTPGIYFPLEEKRLKLGSVLTTLGQPDGTPPRRRGRAVEFDLADARVSCRRPRWRMLFAAKLRALLALRRHEPPHIPFTLATPG